MKRLCFCTGALVLFAACSRTPESEYAGLPHRGAENIRYDRLQADTIRVDAQRSSMEGQWLMRDSSILFLDWYVAGGVAYDSEGNFLAEPITEGRGPNEMLSPAKATAFDPKDGGLVILDVNSNILCYDSAYRRKSVLNWIDTKEGALNEQEWQDYINRPDPENPTIYDYKLYEYNIAYRDGRIIIPAEVSHFKYNGYNIANRAEEHWRDAHIFLAMNASDLSDRKLWGHYPPVYRTRNMPIFSTFDFAMTEEGGCYVTFAADPLIYRFDDSGKPVSSLGIAEPGIRGDWPETTTLDEFNSKWETQRKEYGYYDRLALFGDRLFRTCRLDGGEAWRLQVYDTASGDLIANIPTGHSIDIFGQYDGKYYAWVDTDLEAEQFVLIRFTLQ